MSEPILFGAAYYPEDWPESERPKDIEMMKKAGMNVMRFGEFAWHNMEPRPGEFDFVWLHRVVDDLGAKKYPMPLDTSGQEEQTFSVVPAPLSASSRSVCHTGVWAIRADQDCTDIWV